MTKPRVGVVGASARAAAMSLARAGLPAWASDLFADRDLQRIAPCARCPLADFPDALPDLADRFPPGPVLYTGGLENYPDVVAELARRRPLWGNGPEVLKRIRDPFELANRAAPAPVTYAPGSPIPETGRWLVKSLRSSGGLGVRFAKPGESVPAGSYLQEYVPGPSMSALFRDDHLLGITEQLIGEAWLHARPFAYCGNIGPAAVPPEVADRLRSLGAVFATEMQVKGVWGFDFILREGLPVPVEVNPRYTAGVEVLELAGGFAALQAACGFAIQRIVGKAIYFAPRDRAFPQSGPWDADLGGPFDPWRVPAFADIPEPGEPIAAGAPVLTYFAEGVTVEACREKLQLRAAELDARFG